MFKTDEIKAEYLCVNGNCTNGSTCCVVDPENGALLPLLETDMLYLEESRYRDPSIAITTYARIYAYTTSPESSE